MKLVVRGSVEERIIAMQEKKAALARAVTDNDDAEIDTLSGDDLVALFSSPGSLPLESAAMSDAGDMGDAGATNQTAEAVGQAE